MSHATKIQTLVRPKLGLTPSKPESGQQISMFLYDLFYFEKVFVVCNLSLTLVLSVDMQNTEISFHPILNLSNC